MGRYPTRVMPRLILGPPLLDMINEAVDKSSFNANINTAIITLLLKPNKDPAQYSSYRPLSLLNGDVKLYAKVLAMRLENYLSRLIHNDQTGFIKSRLASDNLRCLLHIIHEAKNWFPMLCLVSRCQKSIWQAGVALSSGYLGQFLQFIQLVKVLYANLSAMVHTGNTCSSQFPILRGTHQGCPLSPLLFALSLEPLA